MFTLKWCLPKHTTNNERWEMRHWTRWTKTKTNAKSLKLTVLRKSSVSICQTFWIMSTGLLKCKCIHHITDHSFSFMLFSLFFSFCFSFLSYVIDSHCDVTFNRKLRCEICINSKSKVATTRNDLIVEAKPIVKIKVYFLNVLYF